MLAASIANSRLASITVFAGHGMESSCPAFGDAAFRC